VKLPPPSTSAGAPARLVMRVPAAIADGSGLLVGVVALDAANQVAGSYQGTLTFASSDTAAGLAAPAPLTSGTGLFSATLNSLGSQTITISDGAMTASAQVLVMPPQPTFGRPDFSVAGHAPNTVLHAQIPVRTPAGVLLGFIQLFGPTA
jgi:hypothetical protein